MSRNSFSPWRQHPWHGLDVGPDPPRRVNAYIELTLFDLVKYEIDKVSGYLRVDRPQRSSSQVPALYGFVPRTYSGERVARLMDGATEGDCDPLDICVLSERPIARAEVIVEARVIGGIPMIDHGSADDKLVGVLCSDQVYGEAEDITDLPPALVTRPSTTSPPTNLPPERSPGSQSTLRTPRTTPTRSSWPRSKTTSTCSWMPDRCR